MVKQETSAWNEQMELVVQPDSENLNSKTRLVGLAILKLLYLKALNKVLWLSSHYIGFPKDPST